MAVDLDKLEAVAKAATPGPWCCDSYECHPGDLGDGCYGIFEFGEDDPALSHVGPWGKAEENATFIALANPATILELVERVRKAEAHVDYRQIAYASPASACFRSGFDYGPMKAGDAAMYDGKIGRVLSIKTFKAEPAPDVPDEIMKDKTS